MDVFLDGDPVEVVDEDEDARAHLVELHHGAAYVLVGALTPDPARGVPATIARRFSARPPRSPRP
jgi:hypothetical protein